jgi:hypothetical protein
MIQDAIEAIQALALQLDGIGAAPDYLDLTAANNGFYSLCFLSNGDLGVEASGQGRDLHVLSVILGWTGGNEKSVEYRAAGKLEAFANLLRADPTLSSAVDTIVFPIPYTINRNSDDNGYKMLATLSITVKIRPTF